MIVASPGSATGWRRSDCCSPSASSSAKRQPVSGPGVERLVLGVEGDDVRQLGQIGGDMSDLVELAAAGHGNEAGARILENIGYVLAGTGQVQRHIDAAQVQAGQIHDRPFGLVLGQQGQTIPGLEAQGR